MSELHELAAAYVLGALPDDELTAFEEHLDGCTSCQTEVARLGEGITAMAESIAEKPPSRLRRTVLSSIGASEEAPRRASTPFFARILLPAAASIALVIGILAVVGDSEIDRVVGAADAVALDLSVSESYTPADPPLARVVFSASQSKAVVEFEGLAEADPGATYQLWLIGADGPVSAGLFTPDAGGEAVVLIEGAATPGLVVGITEEPAGGSPAPTGDVLFSAEL